MKKRFIFDENYIKRYAKKDKMRWLVIGGCALILLIIVLIVVLVTKSRKPKPIDTDAVPAFELKEEVVVESGNTLPEVADYFTKLENIDIKDITLSYSSDFEVSYDLTNCSDEVVLKINSDENVNMETYTCAIPILKIPTVYKVNLKILGHDYTVNLKVEDTTPPTLLTNNVEIFEGEEYELEDFVRTCYDINDICDVSYVLDDLDSNGEKIDYASFKEEGTYKIRLRAVDGFENEAEIAEAELNIKKAQTKLFEVTFDSNGGNDIESIKVESGNNATAPEEPTREGYYFLGWFLDNVRYSFSQPVLEDITLRAEWQELGSEEPENPDIHQGSQDPVTPPGPVNVTSVYLDYLKINLDIGESKKVSATVRPTNATYKTVSWSSANTSVATVNNGVITGVGVGTTTITASAGGKSSTVTVVVKNRTTVTPSCRFGDTSYNTNYIVSADFTSNGCAADPSYTHNEAVSKADYVAAYNELARMGFNMSDINAFKYSASSITIKNNANTGLIGYQITAKWTVVDGYTTMSCEYIIKPDGSRKFLSNSIKKNGVSFK